MRYKALLVWLVLVGCVGVLPALAGDEEEGFRTELEFNYGYLVGDDLNNLAGSFVEKSYGGRLSFGFNRVLNPELQYGYSDRTSNLFQPTVIFTTWAIQSNNWNWFSFSNPIHLYEKRGKVFLRFTGSRVRAERVAAVSGDFGFRHRYGFASHRRHQEL